MSSADRFSGSRFAAVVLDLDGVLTRTQDLHARAWKAAFDAFLERRGEAGDARFRPFEIDPEYYDHVDGKPRFDGVRGFLEARGIDLPEGTPNDAPDDATVFGIGNRKNQRFLELLETDGVTTFDTSIAFVEAARDAGLKTAVVSSSRNCVPVLRAAGLLDLFDARIDGRDAAERGLEGKPAPDVFEAAARELGVPPERCVAVEDATAGVAAARAAGYGRVVGLDRGGESQAGSLSDHGAHVVVSDLGELEVAALSGDDDALPLPAAEMEALEGRMGARTPAVFLDYDGTLTPIVDRPDQATLAPAMRRVLEQVAERYVTAIVSGRDLDDVRRLVGLEQLIYAGSHGFDIALPDGERTSPEAAREALPALAAAGEELERRLGHIDGLIVERKGFAIAVHFRMVSANRIGEIEAVVDEVRARHEGLRKRGGKKILELLPDLDWDKGAALNWLLESLELRDRSSTVPVYVGDDLTDEDAFAVLADDGVAIAVGRTPEDTAAHFVVPDTDAVQALLRWLCRRGGTLP